MLLIISQNPCTRMINDFSKVSRSNMAINCQNKIWGFWAIPRKMTPVIILIFAILSFLIPLHVYTVQETVRICIIMSITAKLAKCMVPIPQCWSPSTLVRNGGVAIFATGCHVIKRKVNTGPLRIEVIFRVINFTFIKFS